MTNRHTLLRQPTWMKTWVWLWFTVLTAMAQPNLAVTGLGSNHPDRNAESPGLRAEIIRASCINNRRVVCGKILQVVPGGLIVDSGYIDLLRPPVSNAWLVSGRVVASRPQNLIESAEVGSPCVGVVMLVDLPKIRPGGPQPRPYDFVVLLGYPSGQASYTSVGTLQKTVRRFSANLPSAVTRNLANADTASAIR